MMQAGMLMLETVTFWGCFATSLCRSPIRIMTTQKPYRLAEAAHSEDFSVIGICF